MSSQTPHLRSEQVPDEMSLAALPREHRQGRERPRSDAEGAQDRRGDRPDGFNDVVKQAAGLDAALAGLDAVVGFGAGVAVGERLSVDGPLDGPTLHGKTHCLLLVMSVVEETG